MHRRNRRPPLTSLGRILLAILLAGGTVAVAMPVPGDPGQMLQQADAIKTTDPAGFNLLVQQLGNDTGKLSPEQRLYLRYLHAWHSSYRGDFEAALSELDAIIAASGNAILRFRAGITLVDLMGLGSHYEDAFARLGPLLDQLPQVTDKDARTQALGAAAQLYIEAAQYDLGANYADQLLAESETYAGACKGHYYKLDALYRSGKLRTIGLPFQDGLNACIRSGEFLYANGIRSHIASIEIQQGRPAAAIKLLQANYADAQRTRYGHLIAKFDALLAQAYWNEGNPARAQQSARRAIDNSVKGEYTEPLTAAYKLLYLIAQKQGDLRTALAYHEKYMAADKGYLNEVSAKALAYQTVKQQVLAKKLQIDALSKKNQILQLQQALDKRDAETSRLHIALLLTVLAFIALWTYRIKRSQLRFMKLARRDGLTGIFNRQHFVHSAEQQLQHCRKSARPACLVLIDLDHFKAVNDTHGHAVGDRVLRRAVEACQAHLRSTDLFGRLGGEEFGILLPDCTLERCIDRVEQIRLAVAATSGDDAVPEVRISASFGITPRVSATTCGNC